MHMFFKQHYSIPVVLICILGRYLSQALNLKSQKRLFALKALKPSEPLSF